MCNCSCHGDTHWCEGCCDGPAPPPSLAELQRASDLADAAPDATDYQVRLIAVALIARQYLRDLKLHGLG